MNFAELQNQHRGWVTSMYPDQPSDVPAAGLVEEAGELLHAVLKLKQTQLWGREERYGDLEAQARDAVGDCAIYACSYCNSVDSSLESCVMSASHVWTGDPLTLCVLLIRAAADHYQSRAYVDLVKYLELLKSVCVAVEVDFETCVDETWRTVKGRRR